MPKTRPLLSIRPHRRVRARAQASACSFQCSTAQNRLIEVQDTTGGQTNPTSTLIARYGYDPLDRRLWKEQYRDMAGNPLAQAKRSYYLYADEGLIAEASQDISLNADGSVTATVTGAGTGTTTPNTTPVVTTQYGPRPDSAFTTGLLFIKTKNTNGQDTVAYYHHDHLDTPLQATDKAGNIVWAASYNAFGQASIITPQATADRPTITSHLRLPGQVEDVETGLHYNYRRYYDPATGRYVTSDPIGLSGGVNRFVYAAGFPTGLIDPYGLLAMDDVWGAIYDSTGGWSPSQGSVDFAAGAGDSFSFGLTSKYRDWRDIGGVDKCSAAYLTGGLVGDVGSAL